MTNNDSSDWKPPTPEKAVHEFRTSFGLTNTIIKVDCYPRIQNDSDPMARQRYYISSKDVENRRAIIRLRPNINFWTWLRDRNRDVGIEIARYDSIDAMVQEGWFSYATYSSPDLGE